MLLIAVPGGAQAARRMEATVEADISVLPRDVGLVWQDAAMPGTSLHNFYYENAGSSPLYLFDPCWQETGISRYRHLPLEVLRQVIDKNWPENERPLYKFVDSKIYKFVPPRSFWPLQTITLSEFSPADFWHEIQPVIMGTDASYPLYRHLFNKLNRNEVVNLPAEEIFSLAFFADGKKQSLPVTLKYRWEEGEAAASVQQSPNESCWVQLTTRPGLSNPADLYNKANDNILKRVGAVEQQSIVACYGPITGLKYFEQILELELLYEGDALTPDQKIRELHGEKALMAIKSSCRKLFKMYVAPIAQEEHKIPIPPKAIEPGLNLSSLEMSQIYARFYDALARDAEPLRPLEGCLRQHGLAASSPAEAVAYYWGAPEANEFVKEDILRLRGQGKGVPEALKECRFVIDLVEPFLRQKFSEAAGISFIWQE